VCNGTCPSREILQFQIFLSFDRNVEGKIVTSDCQYVSGVQVL
jgi:hypothetical protein